MSKFFTVWADHSAITICKIYIILLYSDCLVVTYESTFLPKKNKKNNNNNNNCIFATFHNITYKLLNLKSCFPFCAYSCWLLLNRKRRILDRLLALQVFSVLWIQLFYSTRLCCTWFLIWILTILSWWLTHGAFSSFAWEVESLLIFFFIFFGIFCSSLYEITPLLFHFYYFLGTAVLTCCFHQKLDLSIHVLLLTCTVVAWEG